MELGPVAVCPRWHRRCPPRLCGEPCQPLPSCAFPRKRWPVAHRVLVYCLSLGNEGPGAARARLLPRPAGAPQTPAEEPGSGWGRGSPGLGQPPSSSPAWEPVFGCGTRDIDESVYVQPRGQCLRFRVRERRAGLRAPSLPSAGSFSGGASSPRGRPLRQARPLSAAPSGPSGREPPPAAGGGGGGGLDHHPSCAQAHPRCRWSPRPKETGGGGNGGGPPLAVLPLGLGARSKPTLPGAPAWPPPGPPRAVGSPLCDGYDPVRVSRQRPHPAAGPGVPPPKRGPRGSSAVAASGQRHPGSQRPLGAPTAEPAGAPPEACMGARPAPAASCSFI